MDRLEQLREEFEAARRELNELDTHRTYSRRGKVHRYEWMEDVDRCASAFSGKLPSTDQSGSSPVGELLVAARCFIIARDFNVYEDGKWQMLWKLRFGGAQ